MKIFGLLLLFGSASFSGFLIAHNFVSYLKDIKRVECFIKNIILCLKNHQIKPLYIFMHKYTFKNFVMQGCEFL